MAAPHKKNKILEGPEGYSGPNRELASQIVDHLRSASFDEAMAMYAAIPEIPSLDNWLLAHIAEKDRFFLLTHILRRKDAVHPWLYERCREVEADPYSHLDLWAREHYKSTIVTFAGSFQEIVNNPEVTIGIFSCTRPIAKAFLDQIKNECETNPILNQLWPHIFWDFSGGSTDKPKTWGLDAGLLVKRKSNAKEKTIEAWGLVDGQPTSKHFEIRLYDDVVTVESVGTPEMIQKTTERLELSFNLGKRSSEGGREIYVGTRYAYGDTYQVLKDRGVLRVREYPATDDGTFDGKPVFFTEEEWEAKKRSSGRFVIACQQLQNPIAGSEMTFDPHHLRLYEVRPTTMNVYILVDPANSKSKGSNRTAMVVIGVDGHMNKYLLDGMCHKMKLSERWTALKNLRAKWLRQPGVQTLKVGYEKYGMQADIEHYQEMMQIENNYFDITELSWTRDGLESKKDRVQRLQPDLENWMLFLPHSFNIVKLIAGLVRSDPPDERGRGQPTKLQAEAIRLNQGYRVAKPIRQTNEDGEVYDVVEYFINSEYMLFPTIHPDFMDAMARMYDIGMTPPQLVKQEQLEPEVMPDY